MLKNTELNLRLSFQEVTSPAISDLERALSGAVEEGLTGGREVSVGLQG